MASGLCLWAESPEEARNFTVRLARGGCPLQFDHIYVAKRSGKTRLNFYTQGEYYATSDDADIDVLTRSVVAPPAVTQLVQWCTCDVMISRDDVPVVAIEDTTHIVRMNLYQRVPRLIKAAACGVPSVMLQGTRGIDMKMRGDRWALRRYLDAFLWGQRVYPSTPAMPIVYMPTQAAEDAAEVELASVVSELLAGDLPGVERRRNAHFSAIEAWHAKLDVPPSIPSIVHSGNEVVVRIGAKPEKDSWHKKGSGQMDPYIGMILAAKLIYCYSPAGVQTRPLVVEFTFLPPDFWFFKDRKSTALYKRLPFEFADEVRFLG